MSERIVVSFGEEQAFEVAVDAAERDRLGEDGAREWLTEAFDALGCEPSNPMGKVLAVDLILGVARAAGVQGFGNRPDWAAQYAAAVACLRRGSVEVDVAAFVVRQLAPD